MFHLLGCDFEVIVTGNGMYEYLILVKFRIDNISVCDGNQASLIFYILNMRMKIFVL